MAVRASFGWVVCGGLLLQDSVGVLLSKRTGALSARDDENPLLTRLNEAFPPWDAIEARHVVPAIRHHLADAKAEFKAFEQKVSDPNFEPGVDTLLTPYRLLGESLGTAYGWVSHIQSVKDSPELRNAQNTLRPEVNEYSEEVSQSKPLYEAYTKLREGETWGKLTPVQQRIVTLELRSFQLSGIGLDGHQQEEFNQINQEMSNLTSQFSENVLDATASWRKWIKTTDELRGIPEAPLQLAKETAEREMALLNSSGSLKPGDGGMYLLTLDGPSAGAVLTYAEDPLLRKEVFLASSEKASELLGPDNAPVIRKILNLRQREAELLGFKNYVELSMQRKMATRESAEKLLEDLRKIAYPKALDDVADMQKFAEENGYNGTLQHWDLSFWGHKQVKKLFDIDAEMIRPYFPLNGTLTGLFALVEKMFGITVEPAEGPKWHDDVMLFAVTRKGETSPAAHFYLDLFTRPKEKRAGGWQSSIRDYDVTKGTTPISTIVANFRPPSADKPVLLAFGEVHTLFHEFGHACQAMLTKQEEPSMAGISNVEWDAVELSSQFMEYWLDETDWVVKGIAKHYETQSEMPDEMLDKLRSASKHHPGLGMLGQLHLSMVDLDLHTTPLGEDETPTQREVAFAEARKTTVYPRLNEDRFLNHFSHIFAGGYSAGYYSYKWADVLSADAFSKFEEEGACKPGKDGLEALARVGAEFANTVLREGGGRPAAEVFASFRGRAPSTDALLGYVFGEKKVVNPYAPA